MEVPGKIKSIIEDACSLACFFNQVVWNHIYRKANFVIDVLAHFDLSLVNPHMWDYCLPAIALNAFNVKGFVFNDILS